jgi:hypothetical protein
VSSNGGIMPQWSPTRPELYFSEPGGELMVSAFTSDQGAFKARRPDRVGDAVAAGRARSGPPGRNFAVHPDGERLALVRLSRYTQTTPTATLVLNAFDALRDNRTRLDVDR